MLGILLLFGLWAFLYMNKKDPFFFLGEQGLRRGVEQILACRDVFAAILADGSVVTWGDADCGGDTGFWSTTL